ncbi:MAG TPA: ABC transporter substrate-binding protein [Roseiarcus sp.]|nr:ABC transporter substrate-binding protein [Roseiarcus sp.]
MRCLRSFSTLVAFALTFALAVATIASARAETALRTLISTDIRGLAPGTGPDFATGTVLQQIYEGLVAWRSDGTVAPMLAKSIDVSPDGLAYTFTIRDGVKFHNGAPLTSKEVVWTWKRFLDPANNWSCRANFDGTRQIHIVSVEAKDDMTVVFRLEKPAGALLTMMARSDCDSTGIAHPDSVDANGAFTRAIGTGPFRLAEWKKGEYVELERFADYASRPEPTDGLAGGKKALVDKLRFLIIPDQSSAKLALQSGALDVFWDIPGDFARDLASDKNIKIVVSPVAGTNNIVMETTDPVLKDVRMRRAIAAALDTAALREALTAGFGKAGGSLITPTSAYYGEVERAGNVYDLEAAKRLLAEAGYKGEKITITTNAQYGRMHDTAVLAQAMLQAAGINAEVDVVDFAKQYDRYYKGAFQLMTWDTTPYLDPILIFDRFIGDKSKQPEKIWDDPKAIDLLNQLYQTSDPAKRQPIFDELHRLYLADAPLVAWLFRNVPTALRDNVEGYEPWPGEKARFWGVSLKAP